MNFDFYIAPNDPQANNWSARAFFDGSGAYAASQSNIVQFTVGDY